MFGAGGRMGSTVCRAVADDPDLELVAAVDPYHAGIDLGDLGLHGAGLQIAAKADALSEADAEVAVDFTVLDAARENLRWCADHGVHAVVGTTGFSADDLAEMRDRFGGGKSNAVIAPNLAAASSDWADDPTETVVAEGARGGEAAPGIRVHSVRLRGLFAHQEVVLGTTGQMLSIRHDSFDRSAYMPGVLLAIRAVRERPGLTVGLDALLGL